MQFIKNIKIKNFKSIKNEVDISFEVSKYNIENNQDRLFVIGKET